MHFQLCCRPFELEEHTKENWALKEHSKDTRRALGLSKHSGTQALEALGQGTRTLKALRALTRRALRHLGTRGTRGTSFTRLIAFLRKTFQARVLQRALLVKTR